MKNIKEKTYNKYTFSRCFLLPGAFEELPDQSFANGRLR